MADKNDRNGENVQGAYYVDNSCIGCGLCVETAPGVFKMGKDDTAFVFRQPAGGDTDAVRAAIDSCPVEAIGSDG